MVDSNPGNFSDVAKIMGGKPPNSIKEIVRVLSDLVVGIDAFATDIKKDVAKVTSSNTEIHTELVGIRESITFLNADVQQVKKDVVGFRQKLTEVKKKKKKSFRLF